MAEDKFLKFNSGKRFNLNQLTGGIKQQDVKNKALFNLFDADANGIITDAELKQLKGSLFNDVGLTEESINLKEGEKLEVGNEVELSKTEECLFNIMFGINPKEGSIEDFLTEIANRNEDVFEYKEEYNELGELASFTQYKDGTREFIIYYEDGEIKLIKQDKFVDKKDNKNNINTVYSPESINSSLNNIKFSNKELETTIAYSDRAKIELAQFTAEHLNMTLADAQNYIKMLENSGDLEHIGLVLSDALQETFSLGGHESRQEIEDKLKNYTDKANKLSADINKFVKFDPEKGVTALDGFEKTFANDFVAFSKTEYNKENAYKLQIAARKYNQITAFKAKKDNLENGINTITQLYDNEKCIRQGMKQVSVPKYSQEDVRRYDLLGISIKEGQEKTSRIELVRVLTEYMDGDFNAAKEFINEMSSGIEENGGYYNNNILKNILNKVNKNTSDLYETLLNGESFESVEYKYNKAYKDFYGVENISKDTQGLLETSQAAAGTIKIGMVMLLTALSQGLAAPALTEGLTAASTGATADGIMARSVAALAKHLGPKVTQNAFKFASTLNTVAVDTGLEFLNALSSDEGLSKNKLNEIAMKSQSSAKYIFFGSYISGPIAQVVSKNIKSAGAVNKIFKGAESTTKHGISTKTISADKFFKKMMQNNAALAKAGELGTEIGAYALLDMTVDGQNILDAFKGSGEMQLKLKVMNSVLQTLMGGRSHARYTEAQMDAAIKKSGLENLELTEQDVSGQKIYSVALKVKDNTGKEQSIPLMNTKNGNDVTVLLSEYVSKAFSDAKELPEENADNMNKTPQVTSQPQYIKNAKTSTLHKFKMPQAKDFLEGAERDAVSKELYAMFKNDSQMTEFLDKAECYKFDQMLAIYKQMKTNKIDPVTEEKIGMFSFKKTVEARLKETFNFKHSEIVDIKDYLKNKIEIGENNYYMDKFLKSEKHIEVLSEIIHDSELSRLKLDANLIDRITKENIGILKRLVKCKGLNSLRKGLDCHKIGIILRHAETPKKQAFINELIDNGTFDKNEYFKLDNICTLLLYLKDENVSYARDFYTKYQDKFNEPLEQKFFEHMVNINDKNVEFSRELLQNREEIPEFENLILLTCTQNKYFTGKTKTELLELTSNLDESMKLLLKKHNLNIEKIRQELSFKKPSIEISENQLSNFIKNIIANNNPKTEKVLKEFDFTQFGKDGLPLKYKRNDFINNVRKIIKDLPENEQTAILEHFGLDSNFDGLMNNKPMKCESKESQNVADKVLKEIEDFTTKNEVMISDKEAKEILDGLISGMPEFTSIIGKRQHGEHAYSADIHMLKVLQSTMNDPAYSKLSDKQKTVLKFSALLHDIGKRGGVIDNEHYRKSAEYMFSIMDKFKLSDDVQRQVIDMVDNHHWFGNYNTKKIDARNAATKFRTLENFEIARILAKADLENVNETFHLERTGQKTQAEFDAFFETKMAEVENEIRNIHIYQPVLMNTGFMHKGQKFPTQKIMVDGKEIELKVLNLSDLPDGASLEEFGFAPGTTKENAFFNIHMTSDMETTYQLLNGSSRLQHEHPIISTSIARITDIDNRSGSLLNDGDAKSASGGFILDIVNNADIATSYNANGATGTKKDLGNHYLSMFGPSGGSNDGNQRSFIRDNILTYLHDNAGLTLTEGDYITLVEKHLTGKKYLTQIREDIIIGDKVIKAEDCRQAIKYAQEQLFTKSEIYEDRNGSNNGANETTIVDPVPIGLMAKAERIEDCSPGFLKFAAQHPELGIVLITKKENTTPKSKLSDAAKTSAQTTKPSAETDNSEVKAKKEYTSPVKEERAIHLEDNLMSDCTNPNTKVADLKKYINEPEQLAEKLKEFFSESASKELQNIHDYDLQEIIKNVNDENIILLEPLNKQQKLYSFQIEDYLKFANKHPELIDAINKFCSYQENGISYFTSFDLGLLEKYDIDKIDKAVNLKDLNGKRIGVSSFDFQNFIDALSPENEALIQFLYTHLGNYEATEYLIYCKSSEKQLPKLENITAKTNINDYQKTQIIEGYLIDEKLTDRLIQDPRFAEDYSLSGIVKKAQEKPELAKHLLNIKNENNPQMLAFEPEQFIKILNSDLTKADFNEENMKFINNLKQYVNSDGYEIFDSVETLNYIKKDPEIKILLDKITEYADNNGCEDLSYVTTSLEHFSKIPDKYKKLLLNTDIRLALQIIPLSAEKVHIFNGKNFIDTVGDLFDNPNKLKMMQLIIDKCNKGEYADEDFNGVISLIEESNESQIELFELLSSYKCNNKNRFSLNDIAVISQQQQYQMAKIDEIKYLTDKTESDGVTPRYNAKDVSALLFYVQDAWKNLFEGVANIKNSDGTYKFNGEGIVGLLTNKSLTTPEIYNKILTAEIDGKAKFNGNSTGKILMYGAYKKQADFLLKIIDNPNLTGEILEKIIDNNYLKFQNSEDIPWNKLLDCGLLASKDGRVNEELIQNVKMCWDTSDTRYIENLAKIISQHASQESTTYTENMVVKETLNEIHWLKTLIAKENLSPSEVNFLYKFGKQAIYDNYHGRWGELNENKINLTNKFLDSLINGNNDININSFNTEEKILLLNYINEVPFENINSNTPFFTFLKKYGSADAIKTEVIKGLEETLKQPGSDIKLSKNELKAFLDGKIENADSYSFISDKSIKSYNDAVHKFNTKTNLTSKDAAVIKFATLLSDISPDKTLCAITARNILENNGITSDITERVFNMIQNADWYENFVKGKISIDDIAVIFREPNDFELAKIISGEDFTVGKNKQIAEDVTQKLNQIYSTAPIIRPTAIPYEQRFLERVSFKGKDYKVIDFTNPNINLHEIGFAKDLKLNDVRFLTHFIRVNDSDKSIGYSKSSADLINVLCDEVNNTSLSTALIDPMHLDVNVMGRNCAVVVEPMNSNYAAAYHEDFTSPLKKGYNEFKNYLIGNLTPEQRSYISSVYKEKLKLSDNEYIQFYKALSGVKDVSKIKSDIVLNKGTSSERVLSVKEIQDAINYTHKSLGNVSANWNELIIYNPKIKALLYKVEEPYTNNILENCPKEILDFTQKHNLPIILVGKNYKTEITTDTKQTTESKPYEPKLLDVQSKDAFVTFDKYNSVLKPQIETELRNIAKDIHNNALNAEAEIVEMMKRNGLTPDGYEISHRAKSEQSIYDKLKNYLIDNYKNNSSVTVKDAIKDVQDAVGVRTIIKAKDYTTDPQVQALLKAGKRKKAIALATQLQTAEMYKNLKMMLKTLKADGVKDFGVVRISNYVSKNGVPYFSQRLLNRMKKIVDVGYEDKEAPEYKQMLEESGIEAPAKDYGVKKKDAGYTSFQANFKTKSGFIFEWQCRGEEINEFAEAEHIQYDIYSGKDVIKGDKYLERILRPTVDLMNPNTVAPETVEYLNGYKSKYYEYLREKELGFKDAKKPEFDSKNYDIQLCAENLIEMHNTIEKINNIKKDDTKTEVQKNNQINKTIENYELWLNNLKKEATMR